MTVGLIILIVISVILLVIAGFFIWMEFEASVGDGGVGCVGLFIIMCLTMLWIVYALLRTILAPFT